MSGQTRAVTERAPTCCWTHLLLLLFLIPQPQALPEELSALDAQAAEDLLSFLTLRAAEFKAGGVLVLNFGTLDHDDTR